MSELSSKRTRLPLLSRGTKSPQEPGLASKTKQKVLIVAHNHPGFFPGGGEIFAYRMFEELKQHPLFTPLFLAATGRISREPHPGTPFLAYEGRADEYLFWGDAFDYFQQSLREPVFLYRDFARFLEQHQPDIVHFHHTLRIGVEALQIVRQVLPSARIVYTLHDFIPMCHRDGQMVRASDESLCDRATPARCHECFPAFSPARFKARELWMKTHFAHVDAFVSPSRFLAERFVQWGLPAQEMYVIENGMSAAAPAPAPAQTKPLAAPRVGIEKRNRFGFFGQISPYKGTLLLLEAAELLLGEGTRDFQIAIHGNIGLQTEAYKNQFHEQMKACGPIVQFHGVYPPEQVGALMREVDWVVVPSLWWENAPLVIAEARQQGRPVLCSDIGGMAEQVRHEVNGLHFRARSSRSLAETMYRAMTEKGLWERLAAHLTPPISIAECVAQYAQCYAPPPSLHKEPSLVSTPIKGRKG